MLENLIGAQIVSIEWDEITLKLNGQIHKLEIISDNGDCCGFADFETKMLYSENDVRNPIITNVDFSAGEGIYNESSSSTLTFYGEDKELAQVDSNAGSGSGCSYGSYVRIQCRTIDLSENLASW